MNVAPAPVWAGAIVLVVGGGGSLALGCRARDSKPVALSDVVEVAAGDFHACALLRGGRVRCWGDNRFGALGDGTTEARPEPVLVIGLDGPLELSLGNHTSCAILRGGQVRCWGRNDVGQLGDGTRTRRLTPVPIRGLPRIAQVARGVLHACARSEEGTVWCWGDNSVGQLGDGRQGSSPVPAPVPDLRDVVEIAAGAYHTCARSARGNVRCWGQNTNGQAPGDIHEFEQVERLAAGAFESCARVTGGHYRCRGGGPAASAVELLPADPGLRLFARTNHACALRSTGEVLCWGIGDRRRLGYPPPDTCDNDGDHMPCSIIPRRVPGLPPAAEIALGQDWTCIRDRSGRLQCW